VSRLTSIHPEFVEFVPKELEEGVLYISIPYKTVVHRCACGCGSKITTPLSRVRWRLTYDGETVSLHPSIGNWSYPCQSHYWVHANRIEWAGKLSREKIEAGRARDRADRVWHYASRQQGIPHQSEQTAQGPSTGWLRRLVRRLFGGNT
jgi:hypothetical protein